MNFSSRKNQFISTYHITIYIKKCQYRIEIFFHFLDFFCKILYNNENNNYIDSETGEIQLTDYGVSGICVMNLSGRIARGLDKGKQEVIYINFFDGLNINSVEEAIEFINSRCMNKYKTSWEINDEPLEVVHH